MIIRTKSPTRVDFAGGTLDCWPLHVLTGGARVTNLAISVYTFVELEPKTTNTIEIDVADLSYKKSFAGLKEFLSCKDKELDLIKAQIRFWEPKSGFRLSTRSESPVGGGLGGSSSLCISLIKAFSKWLGEDLTALEMVELAHNLEAEVLHKPTGTQDYVPAIVGGMNLIKYSPRGIELQKLDFDGPYFAKRLILVYTGQPHHSGLNNWQVIKAALDGDQKTLNALHEIKRIGDEVSQACSSGKFDLLPNLFRQEFKARVALSKGFTSERIETLEEIAIAAGAEAVKICGAGGGGCVLVWTDPKQYEAVVKACQKAEFQIIDARPVLE